MIIKYRGLCNVTTLVYRNKANTYEIGKNFFYYFVQDALASFYRRVATLIKFCKFYEMKFFTAYAAI